MPNKIQRILHRYNLMWDYPTKSFQTQAGRNWLEKLSLPEIDRFEMDLLLEEWTSIEEKIKQVDAKIVERASRSDPGKVLNATQISDDGPWREFLFGFGFVQSDWSHRTFPATTQFGQLLRADTKQSELG